MVHGPRCSTSAALAAIVWGVDPRARVHRTGDREWTVTCNPDDPPIREPAEVALARFSTGATFEFEERRALPLFVV